MSPWFSIPIHVTTRLGNSIVNLKRENFRVFEDNIEQKIMSFASEDSPVSIGLLFDLSGSMRDKIRKSSESAVQFLKTANPEDEFFLIEFNDHPKLAVPFTRDVSLIQQELLRARPHGQTALLDALHMAVGQMKGARHLRKALVILSDGGDNHSRHSEAEVKEAMYEADVQVFAMGIFGEEGASNRTKEEKDGPRLLSELAERTGGRHFPVVTANDLPEVCGRISDELRYQYLLGYSPANSERDGKYRHVRIVVDASPDTRPLRIRHRPGYYAPLN